MSESADSGGAPSEAAREHMRRAGRLIMAVADDDGDLVIEILREAAAVDRGIVALFVQVASLGVESARALGGDDWRSLFNHALLDLDTIDPTEPPT